MNEISINVYQIPTRFVNFYLIAEPDSLTLIDTGVAEDGVDYFLRAVAHLRRRPSTLARILITHADPDHYGSADELRRMTGARIYASAPEAEAMARGAMSRPIRGNLLQRGLFNLFARLYMPTTPTPVDEILVRGQTFPILGGLRVIASPGHTPGHLSFYVPNLRLLFVGDSLQVRKGKAKPAPASANWDEARSRESICAQAALGAMFIAPGHGAVLRGAECLKDLCG